MGDDTCTVEGCERGQRVADKVAWARQIIDLYGDMYPPP